MPRIPTAQANLTPETEKLMEAMIKNMGFPANSFLTMSHWPELAVAFANLARTVNFTESELPTSTKRLVGHIVSRASGCQYCSAHTGFQATRSGGVEEEKIEAAFEYETSPLFTDAERAALRVAQAAAAVPNAVTDEDFTELKYIIRTDKSTRLSVRYPFSVFSTVGTTPWQLNWKQHPLNMQRSILRTVDGPLASIHHNRQKI